VASPVKAVSRRRRGPQARPAEIRMLASNAVKTSLEVLAPEFEKTVEPSGGAFAAADLGEVPAALG
jgi:hypothetical protein